MESKVPGVSTLWGTKSKLWHISNLFTEFNILIVKIVTFSSGQSWWAISHEKAGVWVHLLAFNSLVVSIFLTNPLPLAWKGTPAVFFSCWAVSVAGIFNGIVFKKRYPKWTLQTRRSGTEKQKTKKIQHTNTQEKHTYTLSFDTRAATITLLD